MARWARTMIRFRWAVLSLWVAAFIAAAAASAGLSDLLTNRFVLPGAESDKARNVLQDHFGQKPEGSFSIVVRTSRGRRGRRRPAGPGRSRARGEGASHRQGRLGDRRFRRRRQRDDRLEPRSGGREGPHG